MGALSCCGLKIDDGSLIKGLKNVFHPCRLQYLKNKKLIIDGAHNPDGAAKLRESLDLYFPDEERVWIFGSLRNKNFQKTARTLFRKDDEVYLYDFSHYNHASFEEIAAVSPISVKKSPDNIEKILTSAADKLKIVAGSLYMAGEILAKNEDLRKLVFGVDI